MNRRGFTLIELLVVIAILGLLASIVLLSLGNSRAGARDARRLSDLKQLRVAMELYRDTYGDFVRTVIIWSSVKIRSNM